MLSVADCETGIKAEIQLHATDITMRSLFPRVFYFYNVGAVSERVYVRARRLDTVHNMITAFCYLIISYR